MHWLLARAKNKIIFCIKKLFFFPLLSFSRFFSWRGGKCFYFSLCNESLRTTNKSLKVCPLTLMQSEQELLKHQSKQWKQKDSCLNMWMCSNMWHHSKVLILLIRTCREGLIFRLLQGVPKVEFGMLVAQRREAWGTRNLNSSIISLEPHNQKKPPQINTQSRENH